MKTRFYVPAAYSEDGSKVSGVRSVKAAHYAIDKLVKYFGDKDIRKIDDEAFEKYKAHRLKTVSIATVNRELSKARKMFGWRTGKDLGHTNISMTYRYYPPDEEGEGQDEGTYFNKRAAM